VLIPSLLHEYRALRLSQALDYPKTNNPQKGPLFKALIRLSKQSELHPDCMVLGDIENRSDHAIAGGTFGDVWKGKMHGQEVAIKVLRVYESVDARKLLKVGCLLLVNETWHSVR
jgi:hypothetical protein